MGATRRGVGFLTLTVPHDYGEIYSELLKTVREVHRELLSGRALQQDKQRFGLRHSIRAHDTTHGINGWHPHLHDLLFFNRPLTDADITALEDRLYERLCAALVRRGHRPPSREHGIKLEMARSDTDLARYVAQVSGDDSDRSSKMAMETSAPSFLNSSRVSPRLRSLPIATSL